MHSMAALLQFEQGCLLSHLTFLFRQVTHDLKFRPFDTGGEDGFGALEEYSLGEVLESCREKPLDWGSNGDVVSLGETAKPDMTLGDDGQLERPTQYEFNKG